MNIAIAAAPEQEGLAQAVAGGLQKRGCGITTATSLDELRLLLRFTAIDIVVIHPTGILDRWTDILGLRKKSDRTGVIIVSHEPSVMETVRALAAGADDYVVAPLLLEELHARCVALHRRWSGLSDNFVKIGNLQLIVGSSDFTVDGKFLHLTRHEARMLECLMMRAGRVMTKGMLLEYMYSGRDEPKAKIIDVFIYKLRKKLADAAADVSIETIWGCGYKMPTEGMATSPGGAVSTAAALSLEAAP